jgi:hypothetical protein
MTRPYVRSLTSLVAALGALAVTALAATPASPDQKWTSLLDEKLSQWDRYLGVPDPSHVVPGYTHAADPKQSEPLGMNHDPLNVFTVRMIDGEPVLHITGQIFGVVSTRTDHRDYHLRLQFRWGTAKHAPRAKQPRDSGILYHCHSRYVGKPMHVWTKSLEYQVQENDCGDFYSLGGSADIPAVNAAKPGAPRPLWRYEPGAPLQTFKGRCARGTDYHEKPNGEWNTVDLIVVGDRSIHLLNGRVVNVLQNHHLSGKEPRVPLVSGPIQIQSEGAEVDYRRIEIRPMAAIPAEYLQLFADPKRTPPSS